MRPESQGGFCADDASAHIRTAVASKNLMAGFYTQSRLLDNSNVSNRTKTAVVSFHAGPDVYSFVTEGTSVCDVASIALERFNSDWWHGPIPSPDTVLEVSPVGHDRRYSVTVERVRALRPQREG